MWARTSGRRGGGAGGVGGGQVALPVQHLARREEARAEPGRDFYLLYLSAHFRNLLFTLFFCPFCKNRKPTFCLLFPHFGFSMEMANLRGWRPLKVILEYNTYEQTNSIKT